MDPAIVANFGSLMGMLATFFAERRSDKAATVEEYKAWLQLHRHDELIAQLSNNAQLASAIQGLLQNQHGEVMARLGQLDQIISSVASHLADFKPIAQAMAIKSQLSDQAFSILKQLNRANATSFFVCATFGGTTYEMRGGSGGTLNISDTRFIEDDLNVLCAIGLLSADFGSSGTPKFTITRAGAALGGV